MERGGPIPNRTGVRIEMDKAEAKNKIEALLFVSHKPLAISELAKLVDVKKDEVSEILAELKNEYAQKAGGIELIELEDKYPGLPIYPTDDINIMKVSLAWIIDHVCQYKNKKKYTFLAFLSPKTK